MNDRIARGLVAAGLVLAGGAVAMTVQRHEETLAQGRPVILELAPVDPRSLMQGDYMALNYAMARDLQNGARDGVVVVKLDEKGVGRFARVDHGEPLAADEARLRYRVRPRGVRIATDAWFFEEGQRSAFQGARYGELRARPDGEALIVALRDKNFEVIKPR